MNRFRLDVFALFLIRLKDNFLRRVADALAYANNIIKEMLSVKIRIFHEWLIYRFNTDYAVEWETLKPKIID